MVGAKREGAARWIRLDRAPFAANICAVRREIELDGGEITVLKALGSGQMPGKLLATHSGDMGEKEFVETLDGLMNRGYILASKANVSKMEDVVLSLFRINPSYARDLRNSLRGDRAKDSDTGRRRRRS